MLYGQRRTHPSKCCLSAWPTAVRVFVKLKRPEGDYALQTQHGASGTPPRLHTVWRGRAEGAHGKGDSEEEHSLPLFLSGRLLAVPTCPEVLPWQTDI